MAQLSVHVPFRSLARKVGRKFSGTYVALLFRHVRSALCGCKAKAKKEFHPFLLPFLLAIPSFRNGDSWTRGHQPTGSVLGVWGAAHTQPLQGWCWLTGHAVDTHWWAPVIRWPGAWCWRVTTMATHGLQVKFVGFCWCRWNWTQSQGWEQWPVTSAAGGGRQRRGTLEFWVLWLRQAHGGGQIGSIWRCPK